MLIIGKALALLVFELIIEYCFGVFLAKIFLKHEVNPIASTMVGFLAYQANFQVVSLIFTLTTGVLHHLTIAWCVILVLTLAISILVVKNIMLKQISAYLVLIKSHKGMTIVLLMVVLAFCYFVSINGEQNDDATYYIGLINTSVETDTLFKYNAYNGLEMDSLYLRRALATFEIHSAVWSQLLDIHPIVIARVFRAYQNVILTSGAVLLTSYTLFWKKDKGALQKSFATVAIFWPLQMIFANTIYTPATFVLYRAYEAKAFTANFIVLLGFYLCMKYHSEQDKKFWILICIFLWGSMALSTSAFMVAAAECVVLIVPVWLYKWIEKKKQVEMHADK